MKECQDDEIDRTFNVYAIRCILEFSIGYFPFIRNAQLVLVAQIMWNFPVTEDHSYTAVPTWYMLYKGQL